jgi:tRNA-specific 2-thiouridylase
VLSRGQDTRKDQSYALWALTQEQLARTLFPLGDWTKEQTRQYLEQRGIDVAHKHESYELCFVPDNDYARFLSETVPESTQTDGPILYQDRVIGHHRGYPFYTIGQRRGLGIASPEPLYVLDILPEQHAIVVGTEQDLYHLGLTAHSVNLIKYASLDSPTTFTVKIRYKDEGAPALCSIDHEGNLYIQFESPRRAITPGQSVVLYEGNDVVGGGIIAQRFNTPSSK